MITPMDPNESYEFPVTAIITTTERNFLHLHSPEAVLNMIKDGSYDSKLSACLNISDPPSENDGTVTRELFRKELTQSDVGQRKGLVIPKKDAEELFPKVKKADEEENAEEAKSVLLRFLDRKTSCFDFWTGKRTSGWISDITSTRVARAMC